MFTRLLSVAFVLTFACESTYGQTPTNDSLSQKVIVSAKTDAAAAKWYEKLSVKGYAHFRYNRLLETNPDLKCEQCDKGIGRGQSFEFRRARLLFSGDVHERFFVYIQFDFSADATSTNKNFLQVRDAYFDYAFDKKKEYRLRFGQSKVPYGFEDLQSSSNRLPFDRSDALNSGMPNERDLGFSFMYTPAKIRERMKHLANGTSKGTGDYGVFSLGFYNGQTANKPELNDYLHTVARVSYPFEVGHQIIEPGIQAFTGLYTLAKDQVSVGVKAREDRTYTDRRVAGSINLYPKPFGVLAEYNIGEGPSYDETTDSIRVQKLNGGFITACYQTKLGKGLITPYARYQVYDGSKKLELDARRYKMNELELGVEWQLIKNLEITLAYVISDREYADHLVRNDTGANYHEQGNFLRIQLQANY